MKQYKITFTLSEEDMNEIKIFAKKNSINISSKTVQLWKEFMKKNQSKE